jgi:hypothetical protein
MLTDRGHCADSNHEKNQKKENLVTLGFFGFVPLIGTVTTFQAVSYNNSNTSFVAYLTCSSQNKNFDRCCNYNDLKNILNYNISIVLTINILNNCNMSVAMEFNVLKWQ